MAMQKRAAITIVLALTMIGCGGASDGVPPPRYTESKPAPRASGSSKAASLNKARKYASREDASVVTTKEQYPQRDAQYGK